MAKHYLSVMSVPYFGLALVLSTPAETGNFWVTSQRLFPDFDQKKDASSEPAEVRLPIASNEKFRSLRRDRGQTLLSPPIHAGILILAVIVLRHTDVMSKT